ncbi:MAG: valine--tRNA ligase [Defluviicoccus sp.]|nr:valine--tRNA ligase [Defluviicoccus sp.]MDE0384126.1 valine--tRNA ligase [Defluviicoccus sp.]
MDKTYRPAEVEDRIYARWEEAGAFACGRAGGADVEPAPYSIVIPPPNVTGSLHMGHALNNTLQDILIRFARLAGRDALWQPGTDHAGIATQMVVERQLAAEGRTRHDLGREAFIRRVWEWKAESGGTITGQLRRLGASCDWGRERFTMDDGLSQAVRRVFVELYKDGLIYRDKRLVNWDPELHTAISDLEVEQREVTGKLWYIAYPIEGGGGRKVVVATTRPETMLGDTAVAVHPDDGRYRDLVGKCAVLPIVGRRLPIVADEYSDPEKGSGAVKITPGHDFNDFEVGRRHGLDMVSIFDADANLNDNVPQHLRGLTREAARARVIEELEAAGLVESVEDNPMTIPHGDRSGVVIEPMLTDQWFVDAEALAGPAIEAVESGRIRFVPKHWEHTYFEWMKKIQPWCISRQIWWGHRIPAWFGPDGTFFVEMTEDEARAAAREHYGGDVDLVQDSDVLDTWFSSALWPFSTLGWPEETDELARYYPTSVLVTGFDIIFFWVARMAMMGLRFRREIPFETVYIHALVRDERGQKMSKSKGNVLDPLELIETYGADALRFTLTALAAQGRDIKLAPGRIAGYRNFVTKIWNAARYARMNLCQADPEFDPKAAQLTVNRWIVGETAAAASEAAEAISAYRFNDAAQALYRFTWNTFCDWYIEFTKPILDAGTEAEQAETRAATAWTLDALLHMLHPIMPFVTEELWDATAPDGAPRGSLLIDGRWPDLPASLVRSDAKAEMDWVVRAVSTVRAVRAEINVPPGARLGLVVRGAGADTRARIDRHDGLLRRLARLEGIVLDDDAPLPDGAVQAVVDEAVFALPVGAVIDIAAEKSRLERELGKLAGEIGKIDAKLANEKFVSRAPKEVVEEQRERLAELHRSRDRLTEAIDRLAAA